MNAPLLSLITPTVQRESLVTLCKSIDEQTFLQWEHIVMIDQEVVNDALIERISNPKRKILQCDKAHRNGGNTCRHNAWDAVVGSFVYHIDDDNYLATCDSLKEIAESIARMKEEMWALFPIHRHGHRFFFDPPQPCYFDTGNAVVRREIAQWPDINDYASDAVWLHTLKLYPYLSMVNANPIMVMPSTSFGKGGGINGQ